MARRMVAAVSVESAEREKWMVGVSSGLVRMAGRSGRAAFGAVVLSLGLLSPVFGALSIRAEPWYWDKDQDWIAEINNDSIIAYSRGGGNWDQQKIARATEALASWSSSTDWNPWLSSNATNQKIYADATQPLANNDCNALTDEWEDADMVDVAAINCIDKQLLVQNGSTHHYRITDSDIYFNTLTAGNTYGFQFDYGTTTTSSRPSYRGVLTHEVGHGASLRDLGTDYGVTCKTGTAVETMCGDTDSTSQGAAFLATWYQYSLENDDITSANLIYN